MRTLALILRRQRLEYAGFLHDGAAVLQAEVPSTCGMAEPPALRETLRRIGAEFHRSAGGPPEVIALRLPFGGQAITAPCIANAATAERLRAAASQAPLHVPPVIRLAECCADVFPGAPVAFVPETGFFAALPEREHSYGLDAGVMLAMNLRRYGFHGIFHEAACAWMARRARNEGIAGSQRILSIVLEPKLEAAAVIGGRPLTVTGGATPLEGLPGETSGGDTDAGIVLAVAREMGWGAEQINAALTRESGLYGLAGRRITFPYLFDSNDETLEPVREIVRYRLLLACGSGIAAMGGLDGIVFSGRYATLGERLRPWLAGRLRLKGDSTRPVAWERLNTPLSRLLADAAIAAMLREPASSRDTPSGLRSLPRHAKHG